MRFMMRGAALALLATISMPAYAADVIGSTTGTFVNPLPGTAVTTGVGTSTFVDGTSADSNPSTTLTFAGTPFSGNFETPFKIGSLTYYNGATTAGTEATSVDLSVLLDFSTPSLPNVTSTFTLNFTFTPNNGVDPDADADYLYFPSSYGSGTSFDIGGTTYFVKLTGFGDITGDGFLASDATQLHVREASTATANLYAEVTATAPPPAVPEPASWALMIAGLAAVGSTLRRRSFAISKVQLS